MIELASYLKKGEAFVNIFQYSDVIDDPDYIEGAIVMKVNDTELFNLHLWDYVDQLWAYILNGLESVKRNLPFECYFPDQPILIKLLPQGDKVTMSIKVDSEAKVVIEANELINTLSLHIESFFIALSRLPGIDKQDYCLEIEQARSLRQP